MNELERWVKERHNYWWTYLLRQVPYLTMSNTAAPICGFMSRKSGLAGVCLKGAKTCRYNLAFAITTTRDDYDTTICHEVCHAFAKRLVPGSSWHGSLWQFLWYVVCGSKRERYHDYDCTAARKAAGPLAELMRLRDKMKGLES